MKQISLAATGFELATKRTRKRAFLDEMNMVVPWAELVSLIEPHAPAGKTGRPPFAVQTMLRIHFMQQWFGLSDPAMEEALHDTLYCEFAHLDAGITRLPDGSTILRFRHLLEAHDLSARLMATTRLGLLADAPPSAPILIANSLPPGAFAADQIPGSFHCRALTQPRSYLMGVSQTRGIARNEDGMILRHGMNHRMAIERVVPLGADHA